MLIESTLVLDYALDCLDLSHCCSATQSKLVVQFIVGVHEPRAAEQRAAHVALGDVPMLLRRLALECMSVAIAARHACAGAATLGIVCE